MRAGSTIGSRETKMPENKDEMQDYIKEL